ncbi:hypothetical protein B484DRAFT_484605 [Ochromonadaceae sp. CCMP2298]|nr:hypothetical protein B484DRAFT_484605 [Ochromonadaceae sp. CCMP2298]
MLVEFSIEQPERLWSNESYHENFQEAHSAFQTSMRTRAGVHVIAPEVFGNARLLHWELLGGCVCLQEQGLERRFPDSAVCIRLGASPILQVYFESSSSASQQEGQGQEQGLRVTAWACFLQQDGSLHSFELAAQGRGQSLLEQLVAAREGRLVTLGDTLTATLNSFGLSSARSRGLGLGLGSSAALAASAATSLRLRSAVVQTLPADRDILSAVWLSPRALLLGLSAGDSLLVQMPLAGGQATEQLLRDRGELQAMWAGLLGAVSPTDLDTIALAALPTLQGGLAVSLAVNRSGEVRVWSPGRAQVSAQVSLPDLLHAVGALPVLPTSAAGGRKPSDKGVQLQGEQKLTTTRLEQHTFAH